MANSINLVSTKEQIGEFVQDFNISASNYLNVFNRHMIRAIQIIGISNYYVRCFKEELFNDGLALLPCNAEFLELAIIDYNGCKYVMSIDNNNLSYMKELELTALNTAVGYIDYPYLKSNMEDGKKVYFIYKSIPLGKDGYLVIPNDGLLREALNFWLIYKMSLSGYKHPVVSRQEAYQEWNRLYPQARNSVNFPTIDDMQRFTEMWQNPIKGDNYNNLFAN